MTKLVSRVFGPSAAMSPRFNIACGISIIAHNLVVRPVPSSSIERLIWIMSSALNIFGTRTASAWLRHACLRSLANQGVSIALIRTTSSRSPYSSDCSAAQARSRAASLASGATASSRSKIIVSAARVFAFSSARSLDAGMYRQDRRGRNFICVMLALYPMRDAVQTDLERTAEFSFGAVWQTKIFHLCPRGDPVMSGCTRRVICFDKFLLTINR